ncbi:hypothetical protein [Brevifollis gellanilyticus]|uniref:Uncharacterized protein n=1 Tax=Brevifollis gellanilyticus TaxID=748831 RepID=A0A512MAI5_9BACT|nr:hypothetical protein [Brevifollis gellanilyticus]GEP43746.1 hypothetical protein BGE01nite_30370 [Brevifollis gellanilyticus]
MSVHLQQPLLGGLPPLPHDQGIDAGQNNVPPQQGYVPPQLGGQLPQAPHLAQQQGGQQIPQPSIHMRRFSAVLVGVGSAFRALLAVGTLGISEGLKALAGKIYDAATSSSRHQGPIAINLPNNGGLVHVDPSILPGRIPKGMTQLQMQQALQDKVDDGYRLVSDLTAGNPIGRTCTQKDMTDIMFFLQVKAENSKGSFKEGAFNIADPGGRIKTFLDSNNTAYQRDSSHITAFQTTGGEGHRGIDANGGGPDFDKTLPHGMKTLLYGGMSTNPGLKMPEDRLYLKIESHGAWLTKPRGGDDAGGPHRTGNRHDVGAFLGHSLSFIATRGQGSAAGTFKERIPDTVKNAYESLQERIGPPANATLGQGDPTGTASGIRVMLENVDLALTQVIHGSQEERDLQFFANNIRATYDHSNVRFGNEIIFTAQDMA